MPKTPRKAPFSPSKRRATSAAAGTPNTKRASPRRTTANRGSAAVDAASPLRRALVGSRANGGRPSASKAREADAVVQKRVKQLYSLIQRTNKVGGEGMGGAIYGEITIGSMSKMIAYLKENTDFGPDSVFIDVGSGLGKPTMHAAVDPGCRLSLGVEMQGVRWWNSMARA